MYDPDEIEEEQRERELRNNGVVLQGQGLCWGGGGCINDLDDIEEEQRARALRNTVLRCAVSGAQPKGLKSINQAQTSLVQSIQACLFSPLPAVQVASWYMHLVRHGHSLINLHLAVIPANLFTLTEYEHVTATSRFFVSIADSGHGAEACADQQAVQQLRSSACSRMCGSAILGAPPHASSTGACMNGSEGQQLAIAQTAPAESGTSHAAHHTQ